MWFCNVSDLFYLVFEVLFMKQSISDMNVFIIFFICFLLDSNGIVLFVEDWWF